MVGSRKKVEKENRWCERWRDKEKKNAGKWTKRQ